ncbi:phosphate ABC transporter membrane protein 2 (PhoT family) [Micromonospora sp. Llam0]|uniref:phosphate ABC transporter permease PstA n=1 Tax=Micromonospora sp. Llam0 TaxID=2485143 RepID=UPI000F489DFF|nr:phosphate ABC transporter permease PstA [Micromonospora sp. Llam0]ROO51509.1 phosphate ABC transporter membrane protein 2 (PhoT family) [Micromonospora sp. Llam0]
MSYDLQRTSGRTRFAAKGARNATLAGLSRQSGGHNLRNRIFQGVLLVTVSIALIGLAAILIDAFNKGLPRLGFDIVTKSTSANPERAGFKQAIIGTLYLMGLLAVMVVPLGVASAIYLEEYANSRRWYNKIIDINIQNLAAIPAIIYGILVLAFVVRGPIGIGFILFAGAVALTLLVLPTVIIASREAIRAVPPSIRDGSLALGATPWQTTWRQVLPTASPGILTGVILAISRAIGEAAPLLLLGAATFIRFNPSIFEGQYTALPVLIYNYARRAQEGMIPLAAAGVIVMLIMLLLMNSVAIWLRNRYQKKW